MNEDWVGKDFLDGFPSEVDRQTAREECRRIAQRLHDHLMQEWEVKNARAKEREK